MLTRKTVFLAATAFTVACSVLGCAAMEAQLAKNQAAQAAKNAPVRQAAQRDDGYELLDNGGAISVYDVLYLRVRDQKTNRFKFCERGQRPFLEPGESDKMQATYLPDQRREIEGFVKSGTLPSDRYYVTTHGGVFVSVPLGDRGELARNVDAGDVCFWSEGAIQRLTVKRDGNDYGTYHVGASKWDGVLRPHDSTDAPPATGSTDPAASATP
jgi:hypothetical protein